MCCLDTIAILQFFDAEKILIVLQKYIQTIEQMGSRKFLV